MIQSKIYICNVTYFGVFFHEIVVKLHILIKIDSCLLGSFYGLGIWSMNLYLTYHFGILNMSTFWEIIGIFNITYFAAGIHENVCHFFGVQTLIVTNFIFLMPNLFWSDRWRHPRE